MQKKMNAKIKVGAVVIGAALVFGGCGSSSLSPEDFCKGVAKNLPPSFDQTKCTTALSATPNPCTGEELYKGLKYNNCIKAVSDKAAAQTPPTQVSQSDAEKACGAAPSSSATCQAAFVAIGGGGPAT
jgi:hypothetical protein